MATPILLLDEPRGHRADTGEPSMRPSSRSIANARPSARGAERELRARVIQARLRARDRQVALSDASGNCATTPCAKAYLAHDSLALVSEGPLPAVRVACIGDRGSYLSERKGYGLRSDLLLACCCRSSAPDLAAVPGAPPSAEAQGAFGSGGKTVAEARAERETTSRGLRFSRGACTSRCSLPPRVRHHLHHIRRRPVRA